MTYRELLSLYKTGKLDDESRKEIEADIEKQDAISEYLFEDSEIPCLGASGDTAGQPDRAGIAAEDEKLASMVRGSIRRAFLKMGVTVGAAVLVVVLCVIFLLPHAVSLFYYNPAQTVGMGAETGIETNRMSLDLSVYTELFVPGCFRNQVITESEGYGKYDITVLQVSSYNQAFTNLNGKLERGKLTLYNTNILTPPPANAFLIPGGMKTIHGNTGEAFGAAGTKSEAYGKLEKLDNNKWYMGYVSLSKITGYQEFYQWLDKKKLAYGALWCGVYAEDGKGSCTTQNMGFQVNPSGMCLDWDRDAYPYLSLLDNEAETQPVFGADDTETLLTHFTSLLRYIRDYGEILEMMGMEPMDFDGMISGVERDGLRTYGFAVAATKETLLELSKDSAISYIYTQELK